MIEKYTEHIQGILKDIESDGLFKRERMITSPQGTEIELHDGRKVINMCANNYLGLSADSDLIEAARNSYQNEGFGMSSVRFICGTKSIHKALESRLAAFLGFEDAILYSSCFDANGGLFETLLTSEDAIVSDALNHASIIDGIRLCKAKRYRYQNNDMQDLEHHLQQAKADGARFILIATDGVFSMDGIIANLRGVCDLAEKYGAMVMVDDSHATGFIGKKGKGTHEFCDVMNRVHIMTGTLGKALGGASGGYTTANKEIIELLRQRSRPYLFSNTLTPSIVAATNACLDRLEGQDQLRENLLKNTEYFRSKMIEHGFDIIEGEHPIVPVMVYDAELSQKYSEELLRNGVYAIGFFYPVVPKGKARIRIQISAAHTMTQLDKVIAAFVAAREKLGS
jgi:glycine C-acetyltransferase